MNRHLEVNEWPETSFQAIFVLSALKSPDLANNVGDVLRGCFFTPKFSLEQIDRFSENEKESNPDAENIYRFFHGRYLTFHLSDIVFLGGTQEINFKDKMRHGDSLNLGEKEGSWKKWDPQMMELCVTKRRLEQRNRLEAQKAKSS